MPIGVPKIPFRVPGEEEATWIDVYNRLYWERLLFLGDEVDEFISNLLASLMIVLGILDPTQDIFLFINSPGGFIIPGMLLFDTMQWVQPVVHTIGLGIVASMGTFILVGGQITQRVALPYARVMMHQPIGAFFEEEEYDEEIADEVFLEMLELMELYKDVINIFAERTGVPIWTLIVDIERDVFMSAEEAQAHGIVDLVGLDMELISPRQPSAKIFL